MKRKIHTKLENLFLEHYDRWCLLSYSYLHNKVEAEEVVQEVCVNILLKERSVEIVNLKGYIITAIKNRSLKKIKQLRRFETLNDFNISAYPSSDEGLIHNEKNMYIQKAIEELPDSTKKVFKLCMFGKQKYQNVADSMGISVNTVKYHIKKAYKTLRVVLEDVHFSLVIIAIYLHFLCK